MKKLQPGNIVIFQGRIGLVDKTVTGDFLPPDAKPQLVLHFAEGDKIQVDCDLVAHAGYG